MGIIFSKYATTSSKKAVQEEKVDTLVEMNKEMNEILTEGLRGCYFGIKDNIPTLVNESMFDTAMQSAKLFKKTWEIRHKTIAKREMLVAEKVTELLKLTKKVKTMYTDFTGRYIGYKYVFNGVALNIDPARKIMNKFDNDIRDIIKTDINSLPGLMTRLLNEVDGDKILNKLRGDLVKHAPIDNKSFRNSARMFFRDGAVERPFIININTLQPMYADIEKMPDYMNTARGDITLLDKFSNELVDYVEKNADLISWAENEKRNKVELVDSVKLINSRYKYLTSYAMRVIAIMKAIFITYDEYLNEELDALNNCIGQYNKILNEAFMKQLKAGEKQ